MEGGSALEMDGSKEQPKMTAGLDLGDKYSYLCLIDTQSGEVIERRVGCAQPLRPSGDASPQSSLCATPSAPEARRLREEAERTQRMGEWVKRR
jgi:hypothetical protein